MKSPAEIEENLSALMASIETSVAMDAKSDAEIAELVFEHLWKPTDLTSPQSALLEQVIERLKRANGGPVIDEVAP
jgi:hypothetical protein